MTIFDFIEEHAQKRPDSAALKDGTRTVTYMELYWHINRCSFFLQENKCFSGVTVILKARRQLDWVMMFLCLLNQGCWVVPVPGGVQDKELDNIIEVTKASVVIDEHLNCFITADEESNRKPTKPQGDACGILHMTSGTTSEPKFCIRTLNSLTAEGLSYKSTFRISEKDKILNIPPLYHSYALGAGCFTALVSGACLYVIDRFMPREALRIVEAEEVTMMIVVPVIARVICNTYSQQQTKLCSLRIVLVGAGAITKEIYDKFLERFGIALMSNYGSTETGGIVSRKEPHPAASVGKPMDGVEIKVKDENMCNVPVGENGELWVKCAGMLQGYMGIPGTVTDSEGYFPMGDIVMQDKDGYIYINGRIKSIINVGGKKVNPYEVEEVLLGILGVKECVVFGVKKASGEEAVKAVLVTEGIDEEGIRKYCFSRLSGHKIPSIIEVREMIPRNGLGKIKKEDLMKG